MRFAMLPGDEVAAIEELTTNWSLVLLESDALVGGKPVVVADPLAVIPAELPTESSGPPEFLFWRSEWGVNTLPPDETPAGRVAETLAYDNARRLGMVDAEWLDVSRTPVIRLRRSMLRSDGSLIPGAFGAMATPTSAQPSELISLLHSIERDLAREGMRVEVRSQTSDGYQPAIFALPEAAEWIAAGGLVYPWG